MASKGPVYHPVATGAARETVNNHKTRQDLIFWAGWVSVFLMIFVNLRQLSISSFVPSPRLI